MPDNESLRDGVPTDTSAAVAGELATRRKVLLWLIRAGYGAFALAFAIPALALRTLTQKVEHVAQGDVLVYASGNQAGSPLDAGAMEPGTGIQAFPQNKTEDSRNLVEVVRLADPSDSYVAFSAICTHLGCSVLADLGEDGLIVCPCHGSAFDPAGDGAVRHGPAGRPLPGLPITVDGDGSIIASGEFTGPVGPD